MLGFGSGASIIDNVFEVAKCSRYGVDGEKYNKPLPDEKLTRCAVAVARGDSITDSTLKNLADEYCKKLKKGEFKNNGYFDKNEYPYDAVKIFYDGNAGTSKYECALLDITRMINITRRAVIDEPLADELLTYKSFHDSYYDQKGNYGNKNSLKFLAWAVTHSYLTSLFMNRKEILIVLPRKKSLTSAWNCFISMQKDVPEEIKNLFKYDGTGYPYISVSKKTVKQNPAKGNGPADDIPFEEDDKADVYSVPLSTSEEVEKAVREGKILDEQCKSAIENDSVPKQRTEMIMLPASSKPNTKKNQKVIDAEFREVKKKPENKTFGDLIYDKVEKHLTFKSVIGVDGITNENFAEIVENNNKFWEMVPKIATFTKYVKDEGKKVLYSFDPNFFGLIIAFITNENGEVLRELHIDSCLIYGDTLRIVTTDNTAGDIRRETFIPISNKEIVKAAINGPLTKEQRRIIKESLPRCMTDFREPYMFLDKVDMKGIYDVNNPVNFNDWRTLITNISNILKIPGFPLCRVRISEYKDPDNFQLICDENVSCCWPDPIVNEPSHKDALNRRIFINATSDASKNGVEGYYYTGPNYNAKKGKQNRK